MGNASKNVSRHEVACKCGCGLDTLDYETLLALQETCDHFARLLAMEKVTLHITSGCRCLEYNRKPVSEGGPGSNDNSQHPKCRAVDFVIVGVLPAAVFAYLSTRHAGRYGIGSYDTFTHLDTRSNGPARW